MTTLAYPSLDFPGQPEVALEVPDGWEPAYAPGTALAARLPRHGAFAPNLVVRIEQCGPEYDIARSLEEVASMARSRGGAVGEPYEAEHELIRGVLTTVRITAWAPGTSQAKAEADA